MQSALLVLALLAAPAATSAVSAESAAVARLKSLAPTDDQLGELKNANPDAYAMVKALLTKHSMGLVKLADSDKGPDVFRRMMHSNASPLSQAAMPYAEANRAPVIENQMAYNPNVAADKDESMVNNLLNAVAGLGGNKAKKLALLRKRHHVEASPFAEDAAMFGLDEKTADPTAEPVAVQAARPVVAAKKVNSYLAGLDLSGGMPVSLSKHKDGLLQDKEEQADTASENLLDSFSFGNAAAEAEVQLARPKPKVVLQKAKKKSFMNWLGMEGKAAAPTEQKQASYIDGLSD